MVKLNVKNGTPVGSEHLCKRCTWGQCMTGYRESDFFIICMNTSPNITVPFAILDCTEFSDKQRPTYQQMEDLALKIAPTRNATRTPGFSTVTRVQPIRRVGEDEDAGEVARIR
jgi:hypothetical protein